MEDKQKVINDQGIYVVRHTLNGISRNILHTEKSPDEISALMGNHMAISKRENNKLCGEYYVGYKIGDFVIDLRNKLEQLFNGGDRVIALLDCDRENELWLPFTRKVYGDGYTIDARGGEILVEYSLVDGLSGPEQKIRKPARYEVAFLNQLSKHRK